MRKKKKFMSILVMLTFLLQIFSNVTFAVKVKADTISGFKFITGVSITDANGNPLGENVQKKFRDSC